MALSVAAVELERFLGIPRLGPGVAPWPHVRSGAGLPGFEEEKFPFRADSPQMVEACTLRLSSYGIQSEVSKRSASRHDIRADGDAQSLMKPSRSAACSVPRPGSLVHGLTSPARPAASRLRRLAKPRLKTSGRLALRNSGRFSRPSVPSQTSIGVRGRS